MAKTADYPCCGTGGSRNEHDKETSEVFGAAIGCNEKEVPSQKELGFPKGA
jgi:hypothetical protein